MPTFWPAPVTLKPAEDSTERTPGSCSAALVRRSVTARVCSRVEPAGSLTSTLSMPSSSSGRNAPGRRHNSTPVTPSSSA